LVQHHHPTYPLPAYVSTRRKENEKWSWKEDGGTIVNLSGEIGRISVHEKFMLSGSIKSLTSRLNFGNALLARWSLG
jgi:hypothetical protein